MLGESVETVLRMIAGQQNKPTLTKKQSDEVYERLMCRQKRRDSNINNLRKSAILESEKGAGTPKINELAKEKCQKEIHNRTHEIIELRKKRILEIRAAASQMKEDKYKQECTFTPQINRTRTLSRSQSKKSTKCLQPQQSKSPKKSQSKSNLIASKTSDIFVSFDQYTATRDPSIGQKSQNSKSPARKSLSPRPMRKPTQEDYERTIISVAELTSKSKSSKNTHKPEGSSQKIAPLQDFDKENCRDHNVRKSISNPKKKDKQSQPKNEFHFQEEQSQIKPSKNLVDLQNIEPIKEEMNESSTVLFDSQPAKKPIAKPHNKKGHSKETHSFHGKKVIFSDDDLTSILGRNVCQR